MPEVTFGEAAGLRTHNGIVVDEPLRTSAADIFAADIFAADIFAADIFAARRPDASLPPCSAVICA